MRIAPELLPVFQVTLPLIAAIFGAAWMKNRQLDEIIRRLDTIEGILREFEKRITRLEERIPPLVHRN